MRVTFLGTGDAFAAGGRHLAAYLLQSSEGTLLLDCGPTFLASLNRHNLSAAPVDAILLSHFHGDHIAGLPFLFLHYIYIEPRSKPLNILGPPGVKDRVMGIFRAMYANTADEPLPFALEFTEAQPGNEISLGAMRVEAFRVPHQEQPPSIGYVIKAEDRKLVYTGDCGWTEDLIGQAQNADLFICECSFFESRDENHMDYPRLAENASRIGAKRIILSHLGREVLARQAEVMLELAYDCQVVEL